MVFNLSISKKLSLLILIVTNLVPLFGVAIQGWNLGLIVLVYWFEILFGGIFLSLKLVRVNAAFFHISNFLLFAHFIYFAAIHSNFMFSVAFFNNFKFQGVMVENSTTTLDMTAFLYAFFFLIINQIISFINFIRRGTQHTRVWFLFIQPHLRLVLLNLAVYLGAFIIVHYRDTVYFLILLVIFKIILDVILFFLDYEQPNVKSIIKS